MDARVPFLTVLALAGASPMAQAAELESVDLSHFATTSQQKLPTQATGNPHTKGRLAVLATDSRREQPIFARATKDHVRPPGVERMNAAQVARWYLEQHAGRWKLSSNALETATLHQIHDTGRGGILVTFEQRVDGIRVQGESLKVLMRQDKSLVAISGTLHPDAQPGLISRTPGYRLSREQALSTAFFDLHATTLKSTDLFDTGRRLDLDVFYGLKLSPWTSSSPVRFTQPARVRPVLFPTSQGLTKAWFIELLTQERETGENADYAYVIGDADGKLLYRRSLTEEATYNYRVWSETSGNHRPLNGPLEDYLPHPTGIPDGWFPAYIPSVVVAQDGFNSTQDPWLSDVAETSTGNNVDAYADLVSPDGYNVPESGIVDIRANSTDEFEFDHSYDTLLAPAASSEQIEAAVTQLFFVNNWLHDWYYDSGFNEQAGNAQADNFGRGGDGKDVLLAQGQDYGGRNNANMSIPSDGSSPRMQMYIWSGFQDASVKIVPLNLNPLVATAAFGPSNFTQAGELVLANDGTSPATDLCTALVNNVAGKIVVADRGTCTFESKALRAQQAGAIGMLLLNNQGTTPIAMGDDVNTTTPITIPSLSISLADGNTLKTAMGTATQSATLYRKTSVDADGTIDNSVVAHEWGHYLHRRLVTGSAKQVSAESEGWADFTALHMLLAPGDDLDATYALAVYAGQSIKNSAYYGIRRYPYSTDFTKNPLTLKHIQVGEPLPTGIPVSVGSTDNSEVHNSGEVWCSMVFEGYVDLLRTTEGPSATRTFEDVQRAMGDYVVSGMMLSPTDPTFTLARDALLAAISAGSDEDAQIFSEAFARRGNGTCAVAPPKESTDFKGVVESYTLAPLLQVGDWSIDDSASSCDDDGVLDAGERGFVSVTVLNAGPVASLAGTLDISSKLTGVTFPEGATVTVPPVPSFGSVEVSIPIALDFSLSGFQRLDLNVAVTSADACLGGATDATAFRSNLDDIPASNSTDTVESESLAWTEVVAMGKTSWSRAELDLYDHAWYGVDYAKLGDLRLESPTLTVSRTSPLVFTFLHKYSFETGPATSGGPDVYWDGGVIEISKDNGTTWEDLAVYQDPGYNGVIGNTANNPLMDREAFVKTNASWPEYDLVYLNLGTAFSGKSIKLRFRIGTDEATGGFGWQIDNISFSGITNTPFGAVVEDAGEGVAYYADADGDGYGAGAQVLSCSAMTGFVTNATDCNDENAAAHPGAAEVCDTVDNDCDTQVDEDAIDRVMYYVDEDADGYGDSETGQLECVRPSGYSTLDEDCNDAEADMYPTNPEVCDGLDNDCNTLVDDDATDATVFYTDADNDGFGDSSTAALLCEQPEGSVVASGDCLDSNPSVFPEAPEGCDALDNNCDGTVDEEPVDGSTFYFDLDGDGAGDLNTTVYACQAPTGYVGNSEDCLDSDSSVGPDAPEVCDDVDNDCDTLADEQAVDAPTWYSDADQDTYGDANFSEVTCDAPEGYVSSGADCDDSSNLTYPGAPEDGADGIDHNCDGTINEPITPTPIVTPTLPPEETQPPTDTPEATPTDAPEVTPTQAPEVSPTTSPEASATPDIDYGGTGCSCSQTQPSDDKSAAFPLLLLFVAGGSWLRRRRSAHPVK